MIKDREKRAAFRKFCIEHFGIALKKGDIIFTKGETHVPALRQVVDGLEVRNGYCGLACHDVGDNRPGLLHHSKTYLKLNKFWLEGWGPNVSL